MKVDPRKERYWRALHLLSELVVQRNEILLELEHMATQPLGMTPAEGYLCRFDSRRGRDLMGLMDRLDQRIDDAMADVRQQAEAANMPAVEWLGAG
jgi:hypothetical protein